MSTIAVTGATGRIGGRAADLLTTRGLDPRRITRAVADYADTPAMTRALTGVDTLLFVSAHEAADRVDVHRGVVESAVAAGVSHVVYTSFAGAAADSTFTLGRDHGATEDLLRGAGLATTFLRDTFYAEVFADFADADGVIRGPAGSGRVAAVSRRDVAAVAAAILADPAPHAGRTYDLTGPEALTLHEIAATLTTATGRPHRYVEETLEEAWASRAVYGAPDWQVEAWVSTYTAIADGSLATVSGDVAGLIGRATPFAEAVSALPA